MSDPTTHELWRQRLRRALAFLPSSVRRRIDTLDVEGLLILGAAFVIVLAALVFIQLAALVAQGEWQAIDETILRWMRSSDDPAVAKGPKWLQEAGLDITALGSASVLVLVILVACGFLALYRQTAAIVLIVVSYFGGLALSNGLKLLVGRDRPDVVPHLRDVVTPSFPSGHAATAAIVYLTLGAVLFAAIPDARGRLYCLMAGMFLAFIVGLSRVYLGVHYLSDVLAGWAFGLGWASLCWGVERAWGRRIRRSRKAG